MPKFAHLSEDHFSSLEGGMKLDKAGNGSFGFDMHGPSGRPGAKIQSPAQHASVVKAAKASVAHRKAGTIFGGRK